jgi:hypothetical protein
MTRFPHHLLRASACLTGGLLALGVILVAAVGSAALAAGLTLSRCLGPVASRVRDARAARHEPAQVQPAPRAEPAV